MKRVWDNDPEKAGQQARGTQTQDTRPRTQRVRDRDPQREGEDRDPERGTMNQRKGTGNPKEGHLDGEVGPSDGAGASGRRPGRPGHAPHQLVDGGREGGGDGAVAEGAVRGPAEARAEQQQQQQRGLGARHGAGAPSVGSTRTPRLRPPSPHLSLCRLSPFPGLIPSRPGLGPPPSGFRVPLRAAFPSLLSASRLALLAPLPICQLCPRLPSLLASAPGFPSLLLSPVSLSACVLPSR